MAFAVMLLGSFLETLLSRAKSSHSTVFGNVDVILVCLCSAPIVPVVISDTVTLRPKP